MACAHPWQQHTYMLRMQPLPRQRYLPLLTLCCGHQAHTIISTIISSGSCCRRWVAVECSERVCGDVEGQRALLQYGLEESDRQLRAQAALGIAGEQVSGLHTPSCVISTRLVCVCVPCTV